MQDKSPLKGNPRKLKVLTIHKLLRLFPALSDEDIRNCIDELRTDGQRDALEVVGNQIVYGHALFCAAQQIGRESLNVISREDWRDMDEVIVGLHIIHRNVDMDDPDLLEIARLYKSWVAWKKSLPRRQMPRVKRKALQDEEAAIKELFGKDKRTVERYVQALSLPRPIQEALRAHQLPITKCSAICKLAFDKQEHMAQLIADGMPPGEAACQLLPASDASPKNSRTAFRRLVRFARDCVSVLEGCGMVRRYVADEDVDILRRLLQVLDDVIKNCRLSTVDYEAVAADVKNMRTEPGCGL